MPDSSDEQELSSVKDDLKEKGLDPNAIDSSQITVETEGQKINIKVAGADISLPAPGKEAIDRWWDQYGGMITGAMLGVGCVAAGALMAALGDRARNEKADAGRKNEA